MSFALLTVAAALAAAAVVPATADAVLVCVAPDRPDSYVCKDTARPECLAYGAVLGVEFELGTYCR